MPASDALNDLLEEWRVIDGLLRDVAIGLLGHLPPAGSVLPHAAGSEKGQFAELEVYTKVHALLSCYRKVERYHHIRVAMALVHLTVSAWAEQQCRSSRYTLQNCDNEEENVEDAPSVGASGVAFPGLAWKSPECSTCWSEFQTSIKESWVAASDGSPDVVAGQGPRTDVLDSELSTVDSVVTFAVRFYAFRRTLNTAFLRLYRPSLPSTIDTMLLSVVKRLVKCNSKKFESAIMTMGSYLLTSKNSPFSITTALQRELAPVEDSSKQSEPSRPLDGLGRWSDGISMVLSLAEDSTMKSIRDTVASGLQKICFANGLRVASHAFDQLTRYKSENTEERSRQSLSLAARALGQCIEGYRCTRGAVLMLCPGVGTETSGFQLTEWGALLLNRSFQGFVAGIAAYAGMPQVLHDVAVPLWLQACQQAHSLKYGQRVFIEKGHEQAAEGRGSHPSEESPDTEGAPNEIGLPGRGAAANNIASMGSSVFTLPTSEGYPTLLFLLSAIQHSRQRFLPLVSSCLAEYLSALLMKHERDVVGPRGSTAAVLPLPSNVFEECIFVLKMTRLCFENEEMRRVSLLEGTGESLAAVAMQTAFDGIREFFNTCEKRAAATLAHALDYHVQDMSAHQPLSPEAFDSARSESIFVLLDLATLLSDTLYFSKLYADLVAPRVMLMHSVAALEVDNWVAALLECRLGYSDASPCILLLRDMMEALQDQRVLCTKHSGSAKSSTDDILGRMGLMSNSSRTIRLSLGSIGSIMQSRPNPLLRRLQVLRCSRWKQYVALLHSSKSIKKIFEKSGLLTEDFVDSVLRAEWVYDGNPDKSYCGYGSFGQPQHQLSNLLFHKTTRNNEGGESDSRNSIARFSQSTSSMVAGFSSALTSAVQQATQHRGLSAFTSNGASDDYDDEAAFSGAYGGVLRQAPSGTWSAENVSFSSIHSNNTSGTFFNSVSDTTLRMEEKRKIRWSLGSGHLSFVIKDNDNTDVSPHQKRDGKKHHSGVLIAGPPICLIILQILDRADERRPITFGGIISSLPLKVPKEVLAQVLKTLLGAGVVSRAVQPQGYGYFIAPSLATLPKKNILVQIHFKNEPLQAPVEDTGVDTTPRPPKVEAVPSDALPSASPSPDSAPSPAERRRRQCIIDVFIMKALKDSGTATHEHLYSFVAATCGLEKVSLSEFKSSIVALMEKECVYRYGSHGYSVTAPSAVTTS